MILPESAGTSGSLELRQWRPDDAVAFGAAIEASREHLRPWMAWASEPSGTIAERVERIRGWDDVRRSGGGVVYGMFIDGHVVGGTGLHRRIGPQGLEIGYWVHVDFLRRGIASTASALLTDLAFRDAAITHVEIHHDAANLASGAVPRRLGFTLVSESTRPPTAPADSGIERCWRMTRQEWLSARPAPTGPHFTGDLQRSDDRVDGNEPLP